MAKFIQVLWKKSASIQLTVVLCLLLTLDLVVGYLCLNWRTTLFAPLGEVGLMEWVRTYGRYNIRYTAWFFILLGLLLLLCINTFTCTTDRVMMIVRSRSRFPGRRLIYKFAPHLMHYAMIVILLGYLVSYLFSEVFPVRTLVPGTSIRLKNTEIRFVSFDPAYYRGERLDFFDTWVIEPRAHLSIGGRETSRTAILSYHRPVRFHGYRLYLSNFRPKKASGGMLTRPRIDVRIRKDPGVRFYITGMVLFTVGLFLYSVDALLRKGGPKETR